MNPDTFTNPAPPSSEILLTPSDIFTPISADLPNPVLESEDFYKSVMPENY